MISPDTLKSYVIEVYDEITQAINPAYIEFQTSAFEMTTDSDGDEVPVIPLTSTITTKKAYPFNEQKMEEETGQSVMKIKDGVDSFQSPIDKMTLEFLADVIVDKVMNKLSTYIKDNMEIMLTIPANSISVTGSSNVEIVVTPTEVEVAIESTNTEDIILTQENFSIS